MPSRPTEGQEKPQKQEEPQAWSYLALRSHLISFTGGTGRTAAIPTQTSDVSVYCGGLTPSLLTWMRCAVILPSAPTLAVTLTYTPRLRKERSGGTRLATGISYGP